MFVIPENTEITEDVIKEAIEYNEEQKARYDKMEKYYLGKHAVLTRTKNLSLKNNRIVINHAKYITDINVGYLLGNPVEYQTEDNINLEPILEEYKKQVIPDFDHEIAKDISIFGKQYEYVYANEEGEVHSVDIDVRNCVVIYDDTVQHKKLGAVIYEMGERKDEYQSVQLLTNELIIDYARDNKVVRGDEEEHFFVEVPIIEYRNNSEEQGDFEQVISLIDAYNLLQSDRINDKEQLVDALLAFYGFDLTPSQMENLEIYRVLSNLPTNAKAEYLTKVLDESDTDVLRSNIEEDIHKISMTPNLSDENFVGNASGVAIRYKLLAFEQSVSNKERYFESGLMERFELYNNYLQYKNKMPKVETYKVDAVFKRNLPQNDFETSQMMLNLERFVDTETLVGQLSFIENARKVIEKRAEEKLEAYDQMVGQFGTEFTGNPENPEEDKEQEEEKEGEVT